MKKKALTALVTMVLSLGLSLYALATSFTIDDLIVGQLEDDVYLTSGFVDGITKSKDQSTGLYGYMDWTGQWVIPCIYDYGSEIEDGIVYVKTTEGKYGVLTATGEEILPQIYDHILIYDGIIRVLQDELYGFFTADGVPLTEFLYEDTDFFYEGMAQVKTADGWGYIDLTGTEVITPQYSKSYPFYDEVTWVVIDGFWYLINKQGQVIIPEAPLYSINPFFSGICRVITHEDEILYMNTQGKIAFTLEEDYDTLGIFDVVAPGLALVGQGDKVGLINTQGEVVLPCEYHRIYTTNTDIFPVLQWSNVAFFDTSGNQLTDFVYESIYNYRDATGNSNKDLFYNGLAKVRRDGKMGYMDENCVEVIPCAYEIGETSASNFNDGVAAVNVGSMNQLIDTEGKVLLETNYYIYTGSSVMLFSGGLEVAKKDGISYLIRNPLLDASFLNQSNTETSAVEEESTTETSPVEEQSDEPDQISKELMDYLQAQLDETFQYQESSPSSTEANDKSVYIAVASCFVTLAVVGAVWCFMKRRS